MFFIHLQDTYNYSCFFFFFWYVLFLFYDDCLGKKEDPVRLQATECEQIAFEYGVDVSFLNKNTFFFRCNYEHNSSEDETQST